MSPDSSVEYDILIVGAGIFGTSTAYHLSLTHPSPSRVLVIDRAPAPCPLAASSDINKIVRADYSKTFYMDLAYEALEAWKESPIIKSWFHQTGWVALDEKDSDLSQRIRQNFKQSGRPDPSKDIPLDEVKSNWGGVLAKIDTSGFDKAYTNEIAGWADASQAVADLAKAAVDSGVQYVSDEIQELVSDGKSLDGIKTVSGTTYTAKKILLATGAWTPWLMAPLEHALGIRDSGSICTQITAAGVCTASFKLTADEAQHYGQMPVLIYGEQGEVLPPNGDRLFKFTNSNSFMNTQTTADGRRISVPDPNQHSVPAKLKEESIRIIQQRIPAIMGDGNRLPDEWRLCWDAVSPDQNQLICQHPDIRLNNLYFATAGSFHSWKFLPTIGKYVVNVLHGKSNGEEKDSTWKWKTQWSERGAHEKVLPRCELRDHM